MNLKLKNKIALVLSASKGIGFGIAEALAKEGCKVIITSSNKKNIDKAKKKIQDKTGKEISSYVLDLKNNKSVNKTINKIIKEKKKIDILIANGPGPLAIEIDKVNLDIMKGAINTNLINLILIIKKLVPLMKKNKFGRVINLASTTAKEPDPGMMLSNITRAGIKAKYISGEKSPIIIFIARDHHYNNESFNKVKEKEIITIKVIGIRYELNDEFISVLGELTKTKTKINKNPLKANKSVCKS